MLCFDQLSYWEKNAFTEEIDFLIVGSGIVGSACALRLRELHPEAKILIVERGYLPSGASTKNAGFACFGSVTEIADDLENMPADDVWATVDLRWRGLKRLQERFNADKIDLKLNGSWDLADENINLAAHFDKLDHYNNEIEKITGQKNCFSFDKTIGKICGFKGVSGGFYNRLEGELNTSKLFTETQKLLAEAEIQTLFGVEITGINDQDSEVIVSTPFGELKPKKVAVTVNGFAGKLLNDQRIQPARAQVLVTSQIPGFELPGTFHYQQGYYYFRSINNRLLIGGGRNLDKAGETTTDLKTTEMITDSIKELVQTRFLPGKEVKFDYEWAGIMGVGNVKKPIIEMVSPSIGIAVRMGGMGVAIGSLAGEELAELIQ